MKVFLSHSFAPADRPLAADVIALLESFGIRAVTGETLGGGPLTSEVEARIDSSDALVALLTPREKKETGRFTTSDWVRDELHYARTKKKRAIAVVHSLVDVDTGAYLDHERVTYDSAIPDRAILKLARVFSLWRQEEGRLVKVRIEPEELGLRVGGLNGDVTCKSRLIINGTAGAWQDASVIAEQGGTFAYVRHAQDEALVQIRISLGAEHWVSPASPQWMQTQLSKEL